MEQIAQILPEVAAYETGLLDFLLRGELAIAAADQITVSARGLGAGSVEIFVEDDRGVRRSIATVQAAAPAAAATGDQPTQLAQVATPPAGTRVVAVFRGVDAAGEPVVAVGATPLGH
jgi:hypothetical protein